MRLADYIGQDRVKKLLIPEIKAAKKCKGVLRHTLLEGPYGVGKTELARCLAGELGADAVELPDAKGLTAKRVRELLYDLAVRAVAEGRYTANGTPTAIGKPILLIIDEIHTASDFECWYEPLETWHVTVAGSPSWVPYFTLVACTTYPEALPAPFVSRLPLRHRLLAYSDSELERIIEHHLPHAGAEIVKQSAQRARGIARNALNLAVSAHNYGSVEYFDVADIDARGLTTLDREYLRVLSCYPAPVGLNTLSSRLGADAATLRGTVEPFLVKLGLLEITEKGRKAATPGMGSRTA